MDQQASASVDINKKQSKSFTAPTPQNTPINPAPITSEYRPSISSISEENNQGALATMLQGRLGSLASNPHPASVQRRIHGLQYLQSQHAELEGKFQEEILALEKKYLALYTPLYTKRAQVIAGAYEPTEEEVEAGKKVDEEQDEDNEQQKQKQPAASVSDNKEDKEDDEHVDGIPEFWLTALKNHPQISESITDQDEQALKHLVDIRLSYMDKPGFKLEFEFADNDYFTDKVLTKTYYYQDHAYGGDFVYDHAEGCTIHWKENKDLTVKVETKKQRHKGTNKTRVVKRTVPADTFFSFFSPPSFPGDDEELDEEEAEGLDAKLEVDYETGEEFKDKIIPHAVDYFTGKALEYEGFESEDEEDFFEEDDDDDDDDLDDNDDDDDDDDTV
ncbi:nucleosome assembly protein [Lichtheimia corymbifera JMRC:FSU:9682]|uniref:Nucleosome assembly protein n=1 Tax=Lichtheimia corymbifera JMRC:FSU:9682 TaxID=1263082 RepID=A0A068RSI6_9FUNG|nr:nucleosome assembly protein [Lichtheimia corymbifera JMRC:FSU:9682]